MGPGQGASSEACDRAFELGQEIAQAGWILLTGGRCEGIMDAANRGAKAAGGLTLGILPGASKLGVSEAVDIPVITGLGNARNAINVLSSEVVIACGMGLGTASEVALALKEGRPVILLDDNELAYHFFNQCISRSSETGQVQHVRTVHEAIARVHQLLHS